MVPPPAARAKLSRRALLRSGLLGGAFVALSGVGLSLQDTRLPSNLPGGLKSLSPQEFAILTALSDALCPARKGAFPSASELEVPLKIDALYAHAEPDERDGLKVGLRLIEHPLTGALFGERLRPFTQLGTAEQEQVLRGWRDSSVGFRRTVFAGLSALVMGLYWTDPRTWPAMGYPGPPDPANLRRVYAENLVDLEGLRAVKPAQTSQGT